MSETGSEPTDSTSSPLFHVVLHQPDIPQNTGNIGRTCLAIGAKLWLVRPLGFRLAATHLRRAGMDYWPQVEWEAVENWNVLMERLGDRPMWFLSRSGRRTVWEASFARGDVLVLGSESRGLPAAMLEAQSARTLKLPMHPEVRSLTLASTATAVVYEAVRQLGGL